MAWIDPASELADIQRWFAERGLELELFERSGGRWRAVITSAGESKGTSEFVDGLDELDAARRAQRRHSTRQLRIAMDGLSRVAQSEVVQLLAAEVLLARLPMARSRIGRQAALASAVWMLDPERRKATRTVGRVAGEWARLRMADRGASGEKTLPRAKRQELLPSALGAAERGLGLLKGRLDRNRRP
jgi:hypothetical protein